MEKDNRRTQIENILIEKAMHDESFRALLKDDPKGAMQKEFGAIIPSQINIRVLEEDAQNFYLVLPSSESQSGDELTDIELRDVAGGDIWTTNPTASSCMSNCKLNLG
jgi:hypothetical protein